MRVNSHCLALGSVMVAKLCANSSSIRAQVHLDMVHSRRECLHESGVPQIPQALDVDICMCALTLLVGMDCLEIIMEDSSACQNPHVPMEII